MSWYDHWYNKWYTRWFGGADTPIVAPTPTLLTPEKYEAPFTDISLRCDVAINLMSADAVLSVIHADVSVPRCVVTRKSRRFADPTDKLGDMSEVVDGGASLTIESIDYTADVLEMSMIGESHDY